MNIQKTSSSTSSFWNGFWVILEKDLRVELRSKETLATISLFGAVLSFIFAFGFIGDPQKNLTVLPGILWTALLFTGSLGVGRTFAREQENSAFTALALSPVPRSSILAAKVTLNFLLSASALLLTTPLVALLLHVDLTPYFFELCLFLSLGALGFALVGTPLAVMAVSARFPEVLLPMVVFPLMTPILICGVRGCGALFGTSVDLSYEPWLQMMTAFDLTMGAGGFFLFDWMVSE